MLSGGAVAVEEEANSVQSLKFPVTPSGLERGPNITGTRLAKVADNAIVNGDLQRARSALRDLQAHHPDMGEGDEVHWAHGPSSQDR